MSATPAAAGASEEKQRLLEAIWQLLQVMAVQAPVLLIVEDLHWADASTLDLLTLLAQRGCRRCRGIRWCSGRILVPWGAPTHSTVLTPAAGAGRDGGASDAGAGDTVLPAAVLEHIVTRSAGVPLFVEEVAQMVLASGGGSAGRGRRAQSRCLPGAAAHGAGVGGGAAGESGGSGAARGARGGGVGAGGDRGMVWLIYPEKRIGEVYQPGKDIDLLVAVDTLSGGEVLPGFTLAVEVVFGEQ